MINIHTYPSQYLRTVSTTFDFENDTLPFYNDIEKFEHEIGITKRFFAFGHESFDKLQKPAIIWNPSIVRESEEKTLDEEGCLSFLGIFVKVLRPKRVTVKWQNKKEEILMQHLDSIESKCFQHELDHLNGITFNERVSKLRWDMAVKKLEKKINETQRV